jgi:hypothetical protein
VPVAESTVPSTAAVKELNKQFAASSPLSNYTAFFHSMYKVL